MLLELPPQLETIITQIAKAQGITAQEVAITALQQRFAPDDEQAYYDWFYHYHFDMDRLDKSINSGLTPVPHFDNVEALANWLGGAR